MYVHWLMRVLAPLLNINAVIDDYTGYCAYSSGKQLCVCLSVCVLFTRISTIYIRYDIGNPSDIYILHIYIYHPGSPISHTLRVTAARARPTERVPRLTLCLRLHAAVGPRLHNRAPCDPHRRLSAVPRGTCWRLTQCHVPTVT